MGIYLGLNIFPERIHPEAWNRFYHDSVRLLLAFPEPLIGPSLRLIDGFECIGYSPRIEREIKESCVVFHAKTQGLALHIPLLADATLAEHRFPDCAIAHGNIDATQAKQAQDFIFEQLAEKVHPPILTDPTRLIERIYRSKEPEPIEALEQFIRVYRSPPEATYEILKYLVVDRSDKALAREWFLRHLQAHPAESTSAGEAYMNWFAATGDLADLFFLACISPSGPRSKPEILLSALAQDDVILTNLDESWKNDLSRLCLMTTHETRANTRRSDAAKRPFTIQIHARDKANPCRLVAGMNIMSSIHPVGYRPSPCNSTNGAMQHRKMRCVSTKICTP